MNQTKIIATIWPVTYSEEKIIKMYNSWVNIIRFNFSHAKKEEVKEIAQRIYKLNNSWLTNLSILLDTKWPEIRTWDLKEKIYFEENEIFEIFVKEELRKDKNLFCDYPFLIKDVEIWWIISIDSWLFNVEIIQKNDFSISVKSLNSATIWSRRHINLPWVKLRLPWITQKDKEDILFALENNFHFIAASFVRNAWNIEEIKNILKENNNSNIKIISKIENLEWVENMEEIVVNSDWVMVARWDLWIEVPIEKMSIYQREIIKYCKKYWKISIIATHLLETMINNPTPTRAESSDVFNSVLLKPDCLMLSWETTIWKFPILSVQTMTKIIIEAEKYLNYEYSDYIDTSLTKRNKEKKVLLKHSISVAEELEAKAILVFTKRWILARLISAFKPSKKVLTFTNSKETLYFMNILYWISPFYLDNWNIDNYNENTKSAIELLKKENQIKSWDILIAINDIQKWWKEYPYMEIIEID